MTTPRPIVRRVRDRGLCVCFGVVAALLATGSSAGSAASSGTLATFRAVNTTQAAQLNRCTRRQRASRSGCRLVLPPRPERLGPPLTLDASNQVRVTLPFPAKRLNAQLVSQTAEDAYTLVPVKSTVDSARRRRWTIRVPQSAGDEYPVLSVLATSRRGTERTYYEATVDGG